MDGDLIDAFLEHHGVKGQKWGIRHKPVRTLTPSEDHRRLAELKKKRPAELTNQELKIINERSNLLQNFNRMNPSTVKKGHKMAKTILASAGIGSISAFIRSDAGKKAINRGFKFIGPSKGKHFIRP